MLQLLTPTGGRPDAWSLSERWAAAQTDVGAVRWIIVDDCEPAQPIRFERPGWALEVIRPIPRWQLGQNTQARNLGAGLAVIEMNWPLVIWEDDDYYAPEWLTTVLRHLDQAELVGETAAHYYNIATRRWQRLTNHEHAGLAWTGLRDGAIGTLRAALGQAEEYIDLQLWRSHRGSRLLFEGARVIGIKGLTGRPGIGRGHSPRFGRHHDPEWHALRTLIGAEAARHYIDLVASHQAGRRRA